MKIILSISIILALAISIVGAHAQDIDEYHSNRIYENEVQTLCKQVLPPEANWGDHSICKNVFGICMVQHIKNKDETVSEDLALNLVESCADIQFKAAIDYKEWTERSGVDAIRKKYSTGIISMEEVEKDKLMIEDANCRMSSKKEGYTNYVEMLECVEQIN